MPVGFHECLHPHLPVGRSRSRLLPSTSAAVPCFLSFLSMGKTLILLGSVHTIQRVPQELAWQKHLMTLQLMSLWCDNHCGLEIAMILCCLGIHLEEVLDGALDWSHWNPKKIISVDTCFVFPLTQDRANLWFIQCHCRIINLLELFCFVLRYPFPSCVEKGLSRGRIVFPGGTKCTGFSPVMEEWSWARWRSKQVSLSRCSKCASISGYSLKEHNIIIKILIYLGEKAMTKAREGVEKFLSFITQRFEILDLIY